MATDEKKDIEECMRSVAQQLRVNESYQSKFRDILQRESQPPMKIAVSLKPSVGDAATPLGFHKQVSLERESRVQFPLKNERKREGSLPAVGKAWKDTGASQAQLGGRGVGQQLATLKLKLRQKLKVPKTLARNSPEVHRLKARRALESTDSLRGKECFELPQLTLRSGRQSQLRSESLLSQHSRTGSKATILPYYCPMRLRDSDSKKQRWNSHAPKLSIDFVATTRALSKAPVLANVQELEKMQSDIKGRAKDAIDKLLASPKESDAKQPQTWNPDLKLYGYATKEGVIRDMRLWRKKAAAS